ncbi:hypothetical protein V6N13_050825 [Hibiscus sabdariffa]
MVVMSGLVLESGPWHIQQRAIILRRWLPGMVSEVLNFNKAPILIKLWHVPLELFSQTDYVEVEAKSSVLNFVLLELDEDNCIEVGVELAWAPPRCDHCCIFGHSWDKCTRKVVATEVVSDDYVICDVLNSLKVHVESEIVVETSVDENLVSSGIVVESEVFAADGSKPIETAMVKEGVDPSKYVNGKEILVAPNRFDILDVVNHEEENCISPKKDRIDDAGLLS